MNDQGHNVAARSERLRELAEELCDTAEELGAWQASLEFRFTWIEHALIKVEMGHVDLIECRSGVQSSWMPSARRRFLAGELDDSDETAG